MNVDDINLFTKYEKEFENLIQSARILSEDIGMEFSIEKRSMLIMRSGKRQMTKGIELLNQEEIRTFEEKEAFK